MTLLNNFSHKSFLFFFHFFCVFCVLAQGFSLKVALFALNIDFWTNFIRVWKFKKLKTLILATLLGKTTMKLMVFAFCNSGPNCCSVAVLLQSYCCLAARRLQACCQPFAGLMLACSRLKRGSTQRKTRKNKEKYVFIGFSQVFLGFSLDFCKGRISPNILQISPKSAKILPLRIFSVLTPAVQPRQTCTVLCIEE